MRKPVNIEERSGVLDRLTEKGIVLSGARLSYSKWFDGDPLTEDALGKRLKVRVEVGEKCTFLRKVLSIGDKEASCKPGESPKKGSSDGGSYLKMAEPGRIARSVALEHLVALAGEGTAFEEIAPYLQPVADWIENGTPLPESLLAEGLRAPAPVGEAPADEGTPEESGGTDPKAPNLPPGKKEPSRPAKSKPARLNSMTVNALFNVVKQGGLVADWANFVLFIQNFLKTTVKTPYFLSVPEFGRVEAYVRSRLGARNAA